MINAWLIRGDTHGDFSWLRQHMFEALDPADTAFIILGDCGINIGKEPHDSDAKRAITRTGFNIYCVRGNHEIRPSDVKDIKLEWDPYVQGNVYVEPQYPTIKYFQDYGIYYIKTEKREYRTLVISGGYSIDKFWRLKNKYFWYPYEQLSTSEMKEIEVLLSQTNEEFDFVFSHTCPYSWMPRELFLSQVDQSLVDNTMELWMDKIKNKIKFNCWVFGHYHSDKIIQPHVELIYNNIKLLDDINDYWENNNK